MSLERSSEQGDTLVEVLVALSVLAIVVVGAFSLMNKGVAQMYDSMERAEVRQLLNKQIELLNYARDQYFQKDDATADVNAVMLWQSMESAASAATIPALDNCTDTSGGFSIQGSAQTNVQFVSGVAHAVASGFPAPDNGIWIQKISTPGAPVPYVDFYVRACWMQGSSPVMQVESSVVRLYDK